MSGALLQAASAAVTVNLDGESITKIGVGSPQVASLRVDQDGNVYSHAGQIDTARDWIRPASAAPGTYEVRFTNHTGDALASSTAAEDVWHALSGGDFLLTLQQSGGVGSKSATFDVQIRIGSTIVASASYTLNAEITI